MENYFEQYTEILDDIQNQINKFCNEAKQVKNKIDEVESIILKSVLISIDKICTEICNNLVKISNLNLEIVKLSAQYCEELYKRADQHRIQLVNIIKNINPGSKFKDSIEFQISMTEHCHETINKLDDMNDSTISFIDFQNLTNYRIFQINIMCCCLPFLINDYGEYEAKKQQIQEAVQFAMGHTPILSQVVSFIDFVSIIEKAANTENYDDLRVDFYNTTDDHLKILEKQLVALNAVEEGQKDIVAYFEQQLVLAQAKLNYKNNINK